ncbi:MAG: hypothetical protein LWX00_02390 [Spirochaetia bacterium]|nr:hypothetical protein [Spirochaetia bacterium]
MNIEFHYYCLYYLCRNAGFLEREAEIISISSQLVDECIAPWKVAGESRFPFTEVTQNYSFWDEHISTNIYIPFHFIPGSAEKAAELRLDKKSGKNVVTPDSPLARDILITALKSGNLFRIGIALHAYADTWAHQNFSAHNDAINGFPGTSLLPAVGHLHALKKPDIPPLVWTDQRLATEHRSIDNKARFARAAGMIYRFLCAFNHRDFKDESLVIGKLEEIWQRQSEESDGSARISDYIVDLDVPPYVHGAWVRAIGGIPSENIGASALWKLASNGYDQAVWLKAAVRQTEQFTSRSLGIIPMESYHGSLFESWNEAVRAHRAAVLAHPGLSRT